MPYLLIDHDVEDFEAWKPYFDDHASTRAEQGSMGGHLFQKEGDPEGVVVLLEWDSLENAHDFASSEDLHAVMAEAGVVGDPDLTFLEHVEEVAE